MQLQTTVGAQQTSYAPGTNPNLRGDNLGALVISEVHGRYYEGTYRKNRFGGSMQAVLATATIAGLNTTVTGTVVLYNPIGSGVNVCLDKVGLGFIVAPAAALQYGIATGWGTGALGGTLTSLAPKSKLIGSGAQPVAQLYSSASIVLPVVPTVDTVLGALDTGAITTVTSVPGQYDLENGILLAPGGYALIWTSAVLVASSMMASMSWEETPI